MLENIHNWAHFGARLHFEAKIGHIQYHEGKIFKIVGNYNPSGSAAVPH